MKPLAHRTTLLACAVLALGLLACGPLPIPPANAQYCVYDVGGLDVSEGAFRPVHLNSLGAVAWSSGGRVFLYRGSASVDIGDLGAHRTIANAINSSNVIVGRSFSSGKWRAFRWSGGPMTDLGGDDDQEATGINDSGAIVGIQTPPNPTNDPLHAPFGVRYAGGTALRLPDFNSIPPRPHPTAFAVNNNQSVIGSLNNVSEPNAVFWPDFNNPWTPITGLPGWIALQPTALNDAAHVVGYGGGHALLSVDRAQHPTIIGSLGGDPVTAYAINNYDWIVGDSQIIPGVGSLTPSAFIYDGTQMFDLNKKLANPTTWQLQRAYSINDRGQIAGVGTVTDQFGNNGMHAFILEPRQVAALPCDGHSRYWGG